MLWIPFDLRLLSFGLTTSKPQNSNECHVQRPVYASKAHDVTGSSLYAHVPYLFYNEIGAQPFLQRVLARMPFSTLFHKILSSLMPDLNAYVHIFPPAE